MSRDEQRRIDEIALSLTRSAARFTRFAGRMPGVEFSSIAWRVLADLEQAGPARITALTQAQRVAQPSMTSLVNRLAGEGWVARSPDPEDGRATLVAITPDGLAALEHYRRTAADWVRPHLAALDADERELLAHAATLMARMGDQPPHAPE